MNLPDFANSKSPKCAACYGSHRRNNQPAILFRTCVRDDPPAIIPLETSRCWLA